MMTSLLLTSLIGASPMSATNPEPSVAVYPLTGINLDSSAAQLMTEALSTEVLKAGQTRMLERPQISSILAEQGFAQSGDCSSSECAVQIGRLLGVDRMIVGSIGRIDSISVINARLVDVATGEVLSVSSRSATGGASAFLGSGVRQIAHELLDRHLAVQPTPSRPQQNSKPTRSQSETDSVTPAVRSSAIPEIQIAVESMGFISAHLDYRKPAFGTRLRLWWNLPLRGLSIGGGGWYADNFVRRTGIEPAYLGDRADFGVHVYGASLGLREHLPISRHVSAALMGEQSWGRFIFDQTSPSPDGYTGDGARVGSDRRELLSWIGLQLAYSPSTAIPVSFSLAYGPGWLGGDLVQRIELACSYAMP